jgi:serine/threonine-protein kinase
VTTEATSGTPFGAYQIIKEIGKGGMGQVYLARHSHLDRDAALKVLPAAIAQDGNFVQRFMQEARLAARLNHPNIVQVYDFGIFEGRYYIAMEYVDGPSIGALLRHWGFFPQDQALMLMRQACVALSAAHGAGLVHRDLKPDNFMITKQWQLKLVDLGLAKKLDEDLFLTATGFSAGTPHYISPEQIEGRRDVDARADIYSLGGTMFHMLTGQPPFAGSASGKVMSLHLQAERPDPRALRPELSPSITPVFQKMMAIRREDRYSDVYDLDRDLYQIQMGQSLSSAPVRKQVQTSTDVVVLPIKKPESRTDPGVPSLMTSTPLPSSAGLSAIELAALEERLSRFVGPVARLLLRQAVNSATSAGELFRLVADQIPDPVQRQAFLSGISSSGQLKSPSQPSVTASASTSRPVSVLTSSAATGTDQVFFPQEILDRLEKLLAGHVGPLARVIIKKAAKKAHSYEALINQLSAQISDEKAQRAFREAVRKQSG